jgi:hypothetical protein
VIRRTLFVVVVLLALAGSAAPAHAALPPVRHVFVLVLENENADTTFGPDSPAPYLAKTLTAQGQLLPNYYAVTHESLGNYIAMISGQGSNIETQSDCQFYDDVTPGAAGPDGQAIGQGCVYPAAFPTVADQLTAKGLSWKGYMEDMGNSATEPKTCRHPALNSQDDTQQAKVGDQYAARHNPFVYFHSIIDSPACSQNDVPLDQLPGDLSSEKTTPSFAFITPNLCHDGHDSPCVDGEPGGLVSADAFLREWVPRILGSPAYRHGGMLVVTFDEAGGTPPGGDASACCDEPQFLNTPNNGGPIPGRGGGRTGAVVLSPFVRPGSTNQAAYNHFAFLRSVEDRLKPFGADVFNGGARRK